jgi:hypothetical protein
LVSIETIESRLRGLAGKKLDQAQKPLNLFANLTAKSKIHYTMNSGSKLSLASQETICIVTVVYFSAMNLPTTYHFKSEHTRHFGLQI